MAYESRVYIMENHGTFHEKIAEMQLRKMPDLNSFLSLFTKEIDFKIFVYDGDTETDVDCYGDHLKSAPINAVIEWLSKEMAHSDYRRLTVLYGLLMGFVPEQWDNIEIIHYGY